MAPINPTTLSALLALFSFFAISSDIVVEADEHGHRGLHLWTEKTTELHFDFQEINGGANPSVVRIVAANTTEASPTSFGDVFVADNPLTERLDLTSKLVGRAQGVYAAASQQEFATTMSINFVFSEGEYNGSVLTMFGRNPIFHPVREMPIVGGSGYFRLARGYALLQFVAVGKSIMTTPSCAEMGFMEIVETSPNMSV